MISTTRHIASPNFLVIGAGKSGTTSLQDYLQQHSDIYLSPLKEPNYFALKGAKQLDNSPDPTESRHYPQAVYTHAAYSKLFEGVKAEKAVGEISPMYLYHPNAPYNIFQHLKTIKLIVIIRNPVDRLYSRYMHLAREGRHGLLSFDDLYDRESLWWKRPDLITEGFYGTYLSRYFQLFDREQIKVITFNKFKTQTMSVMEDIFTFLGVDNTFKPCIDTQHNKSGMVKHPALQAVIGPQGLPIQALKRFFPRLYTACQTNPSLRKYLTFIRNKNLDTPPLPAADKKRLFEDVYAREISLTESITGLDLQSWNYN